MAGVVKQNWIAIRSVSPTGHLAWELRTQPTQRCERPGRTVPQAVPNGTVQSGQRYERHNRKTVPASGGHLRQKLRRKQCKYTLESTGVKQNMTLIS